MKSFIAFAIATLVINSSSLRSDRPIFDWHEVTPPSYITRDVPQGPQVEATKVGAASYSAWTATLEGEVWWVSGSSQANPPSWGADFTPLGPHDPEIEFEDYVPGGSVAADYTRNWWWTWKLDHGLSRMTDDTTTLERTFHQDHDGVLHVETVPTQAPTSGGSGGQGDTGGDGR